MAVSINDFCEEVNNYFEQTRIFGKFEIINGNMDLNRYGIQEGQYIRVVGSVFNDGVHQYPFRNNSRRVSARIPPENELVDEKFDGAIWVMAVPSSVVTQIEEINQWEATNQSTLNSPYQSESFGGYSYTLKAENAEGGLNWQTHFRRKLDRWRKVRAC